MSDVIGPDGSHVNRNNNAYTNVLAAYNLYFAEFAACYCELSDHDTDSFFKLARSIELPHANDTDYTPAFDGFLPETPTREADTILLSYPLQYPMNETTQRNNLRIYAANLAGTNLPSTTFAVQNIARLGIGEIPTTVQFERSYRPYVRSSFKLWTQYDDPGNRIVVRNHVSGAGAFLQQIINGYAGIRLRDDGLLIQGTALPPGATRLVLNGKFGQLKFNREIWF